MRTFIVAFLGVVVAQPPVTDHDAVAQDLFNNPAATCAVIARRFCGNAFIQYTCPVSCGRPSDPLEYCVNQNAVLAAQFGATCAAANPASTCSQPAVAMTCPEACNTQDASCPANINSPPPPPPEPPSDPPPPSPPPCELYCNHYSCGDPRCESCSVCAGGASRISCQPWCNKYLCNTGVNFFFEHCGGCSTCTSDEPTCDSWCNQYTCSGTFFSFHCGGCDVCANATLSSSRRSLGAATGSSRELKTMGTFAMAVGNSPRQGVLASSSATTLALVGALAVVAAVLAARYALKTKRATAAQLSPAKDKMRSKAMRDEASVPIAEADSLHRRQSRATNDSIE